VGSAVGVGVGAEVAAGPGLSVGCVPGASEHAAKRSTNGIRAIAGRFICLPLAGFVQRTVAALVAVGATDGGDR